jgi:hypothetical protein
MRANALANLPTSTPDGGQFITTSLWSLPAFLVTPVSEIGCRRKYRQLLGRADHPDEVEPAAVCSLITLAAGIHFRNHAPATEDGDPGVIAEALWSVEDGTVVLTDLEGKHITSRALLKGENPATLAKILLRERTPNDFQQPIRYRTRGIV